VVDIQNTRSQNVLKQEVLEALPAGRTNAGFAELTLGASSVTGGAAVVDQGGSKGDLSQRLIVHGMRAFDQRIYYDGGLQNNLFGRGKNWQTNQMGVQEVVIGDLERLVRGRDQRHADQLHPERRRHHVQGHDQRAGTNAQPAGEQHRRCDSRQRRDHRPVGEERLRLRLWYRWSDHQESGVVLSATRLLGLEGISAGRHYNKSASPFAYVADLDRPAYADGNAKDEGIRISVQASPSRNSTCRTTTSTVASAIKA